MSIFHQLTEKPWMTPGGTVADPREGDPFSLSTKKLALRIFLGVVSVLFMLMIIAYGDRMAYEDWRPTPQLELLWNNTFVLILSSIALQWAQYSVRHGKIDSMRVSLLAGGALTIVFLVGQIMAWRQLAAMNYFDITNPAIAFFYMITGIHGLHLLGGLVAWSRTVIKVWGDFNLAQIQRSVELCTTYWHFMLLVWLILFGLLFSGDNLDLLLKLCGIR